MAVCGLRITIWRVASTPFKCGMAMSITTTSGFPGGGHLHGFAAVGGFAHDLPGRPAVPATGAVRCASPHDRRPGESIDDLRHH